MAKILKRVKDVSELIELLTNEVVTEQKELEVDTWGEGVLRCVELKNKHLVKPVTIGEGDKDIVVYTDGKMVWKSELSGKKCEYVLFNMEKMVEKYWKKRMAERANVSAELERLMYVLKGRCYEESKYSGESVSLWDMYDDKRPYGNKNIPKSIVFVLGWDNKGIMRYTYELPEYVVEETNKLHLLIKEEIEKEMKG